jgi:hypothetical protein
MPPGAVLASGHDQGNLVADAQPETPRRDITQYHAKFAGLKVFHAPLHDVPGHDGHLAFECRINAADLNRLHRPLVGEHPFHLGERHCGRDLGVFHGGFSHRAPVIDGLYAHDRGMGHHAKDAVTHFTLKTVHHREHHNHGQYAQGEADHRGHGDERNKTIAALGAGIARADKNR